MRHTKMIEPRAAIETYRIYDEGIPFPVADRDSIKGGVRIFGKLAAGGPYCPVRMRPLKELENSVLGWNHLHSIDADFKNDVPHQSQRIAIPCRVVSQCWRDGARSVGRLIRIE